MKFAPAYGWITVSNIKIYGVDDKAMIVRLSESNRIIEQTIPTTNFPPSYPSTGTLDLIIVDLTQKSVPEHPPKLSSIN